MKKFEQPAPCVVPNDQELERLLQEVRSGDEEGARAKLMEFLLDGGIRTCGEKCTDREGKERFVGEWLRSVGSAWHTLVKVMGPRGMGRPPVGELFVDLVDELTGVTADEGQEAACQACRGYTQAMLDRDVVGEAMAKAAEDVSGKSTSFFELS